MLNEERANVVFEELDALLILSMREKAARKEGEDDSQRSGIYGHKAGERGRNVVARVKLEG